MSELRAFYAKLLKAIDRPCFARANWQLCERSGWPDNPSFLNLVAWSWTDDDDRYLIIVNLSDSQVARPGEDSVAGRSRQDLAFELICCRTLFTNAMAMQMLSPGLYVELEPWGYNLFHCTLE